MSVIQWLNEFSDEDDTGSFIDDEDNDPDFEMPGLQNRNADNSNDVNEQISDDDENSVEPSSEEDNNDQSNDAQTNNTIELNSINWGPVSGNLNDFPYNPNNDFVGINPDIIECMSGCSPYDFFSLFVDNTVLDFLVVETNRYAQLKLNKVTSRFSRLSMWYETDQTEIRNFLGLILWMWLNT